MPWSPSGAEAVPALALALFDPSRVRRLNAAQTLKDMGPKASSSLSDLRACLLRDPDLEVKESCAWALSSMGRQAIPALRWALRRGDVDTRRTAVGWLECIRPVRPVVVRALSQALRDSDGEVKRRAADNLVALGAPAFSAIPSLVAALRDHEPKTWRSIAFALCRFGPRAVSPLARALGRGNAAVRRRAAFALGCSARAQSQAARRVLERARRDPNQSVRREVETALLPPVHRDPLDGLDL